MVYSQAQDTNTGGVNPHYWPGTAALVPHVLEQEPGKHSQRVLVGRAHNAKLVEMNCETNDEINSEKDRLPYISRRSQLLIQ